MFNYASSQNSEIIFSISNQKNIEGDVYKLFEFDSDVQRMSVVYKTKEGDFYSLCKGSP